MESLPLIENLNPRMLAAAYRNYYENGVISWSNEEREQFLCFGFGGIVDNHIKEKLYFIRDISKLSEIKRRDLEHPIDEFELKEIYEDIKDYRKFERSFDDLKISKYDIKFLTKLSETYKELIDMSNEFFGDNLDKVKAEAEEIVEDCNELMPAYNKKQYFKVYSKFHERIKDIWINFTVVKMKIGSSQGLPEEPIFILGSNCKDVFFGI